MKCAPLQVGGLSVHYRRRAVLQDLSMPALAPGRVLALVGPNGAGKSTLLRALAGLVPAQGRVVHGDCDLLALNPQARAALVGFMPQQLPAGSSLTVLEATLAALHGCAPRSGESQVARALSVLQSLGVQDLAMRALDELSGGQRQMAGLAQAVVRDCPVLLLDEPVSALDLAYQWRVLDTVRALAREGRTVVMVLHDLTLAAQWADDVAVLQQGRLLAFGTPAQAITPQVLRNAYGVQARVGQCAQGRLYVMVDGPAEPAKL